jgi:hypothetical protein
MNSIGLSAGALVAWAAVSVIAQHWHRPRGQLKFGRWAILFRRDLGFNSWSLIGKACPRGHRFSDEIMLNQKRWSAMAIRLDPIAHLGDAEQFPAHPLTDTDPVGWSAPIT